MIGRGEQFYSMYTNPVWFRKIFQDCTHRAVYKHWNRWCFKKGHIYYFDKKQNDFFKKLNDSINENFRLKQENEQLKEKNKQLRHDLNVLRRGVFGD